MKSARTKATVIDLLSQGLPVTLATAAAGVGRSTFYKWLEDPKFSEQVETAQARSAAPLLARITSASETQWQAAAWILERRWPGEFGRRERIQAELTAPVEVYLRQLEGLSDDQLQRIASGEDPRKVITGS